MTNMRVQIDVLWGIFNFVEYIQRCQSVICYCMVLSILEEHVVKYDLVQNLMRSHTFLQPWPTVVELAY